MSRSRPVRAAALAAALTLSLGLAACGGDDDSADVVDSTTTSQDTSTAESGGDDTTTTTEGTDDTTTTTEADDTTTTTEGGGEAPDDLAGALLTTADLPAGFAQEGEDDTGIDSSESGLCEGVPATELPTPTEQIERSFQTADHTSSVGSFVGRYGAGDGAGMLQWFREEAGRCDTEDPETSYDAEDLAGVGDEAVVLTAAEGSGASATVGVARVGDVVVGVSVFADAESGVDIEDLLALSVSRL